MPSSPVWLHIYCPHPLSCCIYTALVSLLFGTVIPTYFNILMEMFLLPCFTAFSLHTRLQIQCSLRLFEPHPICCSWSCGMHVCNNEEMAFNYTEVLVDSCCSRSRKILMAKDHARERNKPFYAKTKVNAFANFDV